MSAHAIIELVGRSDFAAQLLAHLYRGPAPMSKADLHERFQECCKQLDTLSAEALAGKRPKEQAHELMVPLAEEALAIYSVL